MISVHTELAEPRRLERDSETEAAKKEASPETKGEGEGLSPQVTLPESLTSSTLLFQGASMIPYIPRSSVIQARLLELLFLSGSFRK